MKKGRPKIDILINNGGLSMRASALETKLEMDQYIMTVNFMSAVALTKVLDPFS
jgi:dehydrogenase/reductase SDR family protein 7B